MAGLKFRRQQVMGPYVLDFYCHQRGLAIEVDGSQHFEAPQEALDQTRTAWLNARGIRVLRFTNREVLTETNQVLEQILGGVQDNPLPSP